MKKRTLILFIFLSLQFIFAKEAKIFLKQVELEKIYTSKITSFLEKIFDDPANYYVFADVQLIEKPIEPVSDGSDNSDTSTNQDVDINPFGYTFIEGLGLDGGLPTLPGPDVINNTPNNTNKNNDGEYIMTGLRISVYLSESIYTVEARETITNFVNTNIEEIRNCFDCFVLDKMPDSDSNSISNDDRFQQLQDAYDKQADDIQSVLLSYEELQDSIKWSIFEEKQNELKLELQRMIDKSDESTGAQRAEIEELLLAFEREREMLERQLDNESSSRAFWEDQEARRKDLERNLDSLKYVNLIEIEREYRLRQNQLLEQLSLDYEESIQSRLDDAKETESRLFDLLDNQSVSNSTNNDVTIDPYQGQSNRYMLYIIIGIGALVFIVILIVLLTTKKKKVVYLKPKDTPPAPAPTPTPTAEFNAPPTDSNDNSDVIRSEVRSLRQSAVTMSAGQKEGASQIISDWLDESSEDADGAEDVDDDNNSDKEE